MEFVYSKFHPITTTTTIQVGHDSSGGGPEDFDQLFCPKTRQKVVERFETVRQTHWKQIVMTFWRVKSSDRIFWSEEDTTYRGQEEEEPRFYLPGDEPTPSCGFQSACLRKAEEEYPEEKWWDD